MYTERRRAAPEHMRIRVRASALLPGPYLLVPEILVHHQAHVELHADEQDTPYRAAPSNPRG